MADSTYRRNKSLTKRSEALETNFFAIGCTSHGRARHGTGPTCRLLHPRAPAKCRNQRVRQCQGDGRAHEVQQACRTPSSRRPPQLTLVLLQARPEAAKAHAGAHCFRLHAPASMVPSHQPIHLHSPTRPVTRDDGSAAQPQPEPMRAIGMAGTAGAGAAGPVLTACSLA